MTHPCIHSMTAFAREECADKSGTIIWEIRSVNHRFLDYNIRLPESLRSIEMPVRECINKRLKRGRVEATLTYNSSSGTENNIEVNTAVVKQLTATSATIVQLAENPVPLSVADILNWPGVIQLDDSQVDKLHTIIFAALQRCLDNLVATRQREGEALKIVILQRLKSMLTEMAKIADNMPAILQSMKDKLKQQFEEIAINYDPERFEQETLLLIQKADIEEELDRLQTHTQEVMHVLEKDGVIGRRLDFLMQELNREANTIGSKSISPLVTSTVVELKVLIEQMREQIQNIE